MSIQNKMKERLFPKIECKLNKCKSNGGIR